MFSQSWRKEEVIVSKRIVQFEVLEKVADDNVNSTLNIKQLPNGFIEMLRNCCLMFKVITEIKYN